MPSYLDFLPLTNEDTSTIRARLDADANAGIDPADDAYVDLTEAGFYYDATQPAVLEADRLWDFLGTEVPAAMFPAFAFADYLDNWGDTLDVPRKDAVAATGAVTFTGEEGKFIASHTQVSAPLTDSDADAVVYETTASGTIAGGSVTLPVQALTAGAAGNQPTGAVQILESPSSGVSSVTNAAAITGGADVETDDLYRERILLAFTPATGAGTVADYERWALAYPGVGGVTVEPLWSGNGTVRVVVVDGENHPVSAAIVDGLQAYLDPVAGEGRGVAPVGAIVTVDTPASVTVDVAATLSLPSGYSEDGSGGTINVTPDVEAAIAAYIASLAPSDDVVLAKAGAAILSSAGVHDFSGLTLNGSAANVAIGPLEVAELGTVTLT